MRANEYQTRAMSTRLPSCGNAIYMLFGLMAEVGEIADKIAKWRRKGVCRLDMDHLVFNTGDLQEAEGYKRSGIVRGLSRALPIASASRSKRSCSRTSTNSPAAASAA